MKWRVDTCEFKKRIQAAGFTDEQATGLTEIMRDTWPELFLAPPVERRAEAMVVPRCGEILRLYGFQWLVASIAIVALIFSIFW